MRQTEGPRPTDMPVYAAMVRLVDWRSRQPAWHSYTDTSIQSPSPLVFGAAEGHQGGDRRHHAGVVVGVMAGQLEGFAVLMAVGNQGAAHGLQG